MTKERKDVIKKLEKICSNYAEETSPLTKSVLDGIKYKYSGKTIKFLKQPGLYFMVDNISLGFDESVVMIGTKIMGSNIIQNERFVLDLKEMKDEFFQVIDDEDMEQEYLNFIDKVRENRKKRED